MCVASRAQHPLTKGIGRGRFPSLKATSWRIQWVKDETRFLLFEHHICPSSGFVGVEIKIWSHIKIVITIALSDFVVTVYSSLYEQNVRSSVLPASGLDFLFAHASWIVTTNFSGIGLNISNQAHGLPFAVFSYRWTSRRQKRFVSYLIVIKIWRGRAKCTCCCGGVVECHLFVVQNNATPRQDCNRINIQVYQTQFKKKYVFLHLGPTDGFLCVGLVNYDITGLCDVTNSFSCIKCD